MMKFGAGKSSIILAKSLGLNFSKCAPFFREMIIKDIMSLNHKEKKKTCKYKNTPWGRRGRIRPQHPLACRKRRLNGAACLPWAATRVA